MSLFSGVAEGDGRSGSSGTVPGAFSFVCDEVAASPGTSEELAGCEGGAGSLEAAALS